MLNQIAARIKYPEWVRYCARYSRLDLLDRCLDGTLYDVLPYSYYDERKTNGDPVPMKDRRPAAQFHLPQLVARSCARKLFSGRHIPRIRNADNPKLALEFEKNLTNWKLWEALIEAASRGSVGSVAVTFRVSEDQRISFSVWPSKYCTPTFDDMGQLAALRVAYVTTAAQLEAAGAEGLNPTRMYWFVRDYLPTSEINYVPLEHDQWNPVGVNIAEGIALTPREEITHNFGFVPGVWFRNLAGGETPDGLCTWRPALENSIELDYDLSQSGRGVRYNCAPQLVVIGQLAGDTTDDDGVLHRGPADYLQFNAAHKTEDGETIGGGDAKLLEMDGAGTKAALDLTERLRALALEQICASRKNPEQIKGVLSGRAMEYLDEDFNDLVMELRTAYDPIELVGKVAMALGMDDLVGGLVSQWPRLYAPTVQDIALLIPALIAAIGGDQQAQAKPTNPGEVAPKPLPQVPPLLTHQEARAILVSNLDLGLMDIDGEDAVPDADLTVVVNNTLATGVEPLPLPIEATE